MGTAIKSPFYRRKSAQWDENKHARDAGKFSSQPGAGAAPKPAAGGAPAAGSISDAKVQQNVALLKEKYGDQALSKLQDMRAKVANDPAKVAAIDKIYAAMKPPSRQAANKEMAQLAAGRDEAKLALETHNEAMDRGRERLEAGFDKQHQEIIARRDAKIAQIKQESEARLAARSAKREQARGLPSPLKAKTEQAKGFEDDVMKSPFGGTGFFGGTKTVELDANPGIRTIAKMAQGSEAGVRGLIDKNGSIAWDGAAALHSHVREHLNRPDATGFHVEKKGDNQYEVKFYGQKPDGETTIAQAKDYLNSRLFRDAEPKLINAHTLLITIKSLRRAEKKSIPSPLNRG